MLGRRIGTKLETKVVESLQRANREAARREEADVYQIMDIFIRWVVTLGVTNVVLHVSCNNLVKSETFVQHLVGTLVRHPSLTVRTISLV